jgi:hypothetical protein
MAARTLPQNTPLLVPNALAAPFTFEKANSLSLFGIEELMGEAKGGGTRWAVQKPISILRQRLLIVLHAPSPATGAKLTSELLFPKLRLGRFQIQTRPLGVEQASTRRLWGADWHASAA